MNHMINKKQSGFTIIELTLAMAFVSVLLVAIALTVIQICGIYNRGVTLKEVNQAGRSISTDLQNSITATTPFSVDPQVGDVYLNPSTEYAKSSIVSQEWGGSLCLGQFSYIWNNGKSISDAINSGDYAKLNKYSGVTYSGTVSDGDIIRFIKIYDPNADYCVKNSQDNIPLVTKTKSTELLNVGQNNLVIHKFAITTADSDAVNQAVVTTSQQLYDITFMIGTNDRSALNLDSNGVALSCAPPSVLTSDPTYCSVQQFHFVARAGNTK